jgi:1,4-alpha-glucan branching enzyme
MADKQTLVVGAAETDGRAAFLLADSTVLPHNHRDDLLQARLVTFVCDIPSAAVVAIAGTFTNWQPQLMYQDDMGVWGIAQRLLPGEYEYRVMIDGIWRADPSNPRKAVNQYGAENSVLVVQ